MSKEKEKNSKKHKANEEKCKKKELDQQKEEKKKKEKKRNKVLKIVMVSLIRERLIMRWHCLTVERTNYYVTRSGTLVYPVHASLQALISEMSLTPGF